MQRPCCAKISNLHPAVDIKLIHLGTVAHYHNKITSGLKSIFESVDLPPVSLILAPTSEALGA